VAMGLDGTGFDEDDDALREMRIAYQLHRGWGFDTTMTRQQLWAFAGQHGPRSVGGSGAVASGRLVPGAPADLLLLDWDQLDDDALFGDVDPLDLLLARANGTHIAKVIVGGQTVVEAGRVLGIDEPALRAELISQARAALAADGRHGQWRHDLQALAEDLGPFYRDGPLGCCT
jgi:5-methylthioadenosine/S-adenosylhomocysteine deaminase